MTYPDAVTTAITKELRLGHTIGPFAVPPLPNFVVNSLGLRPKKSGGHHIIMDLSQPRNDSVNHYINKEDYTLTYSRVDDAVAILQRLGQGALITKVDIKHAFRLCPVRKKDWHLFGFKWQGLFFFDRMLPFGLRSAPFLFNRLAEALLWIVKNRANTQDLLHYLDDYFGAGPPQLPAMPVPPRHHAQHMPRPRDTHRPRKVEGPSPTMTFLGITLDTLTMTLCLPTTSYRTCFKHFPLGSTDTHALNGSCYPSPAPSILHESAFPPVASSSAA
ncbi:uncharacterized protein [Ptychodera flava]|uniref:uncharacterized protein n=1 Tax=Ptychodera flava TaxID=63121 RepID=UPI00396A8A26